MPRPKYTGKDENQPTILKYARELGMVTWDTADLGGEILDAVICWRGHCLPVEIKMPGKEKDLTPGEITSIAKLRRVGVTAAIITSIDDLLAAFEELTSNR